MASMPSSGVVNVFIECFCAITALSVLTVQNPLRLGGNVCENQCNCKVSVIGDDPKAVYSAMIRCSKGSLEWTDAYGAIRLEIQPPSLSAFRLCFYADSRNTDLIVYQEGPVSKELTVIRQRMNSLSTPEEASVGGGLTRLLTLEGRVEQHSEETCVTGSPGTHVLLYLEIVRKNTQTGVSVVSLTYDVEPWLPGLLVNDMEECRPCTDVEMLESYCTSDFVVVGKIHEVLNVKSIAHVRVAVAQLVHQNLPVFRRVRRTDRFLFGTLQVPAQCGVKRGHTDLVITGRMRLRKPKLTCAVLYSNWLTIARFAECVH